ncbi:MAG: hypothetical protein ACWGNI_00425 [Desulfobacterales bacterium]
MKTVNLKLTDKEKEEIRQLSIKTRLTISDLYRIGGPKYGKELLEAINSIDKVDKLKE